MGFRIETLISPICIWQIYLLNRGKNQLGNNRCRYHGLTILFNIFISQIDYKPIGGSQCLYQAPIPLIQPICLSGMKPVGGERVLVSRPHHFLFDRLS